MDDEGSRIEGRSQKPFDFAQGRECVERTGVRIQNDEQGTPDRVRGRLGNPAQLSFRRKPESRSLILFFVFWIPDQVRYDELVDFNQPILEPLVL